MLIHPRDFHSEGYMKYSRMGLRQSHEVQEEKQTNKIKETNLNLGVVNFQEETFSTKRFNRIEIGVVFIILLLFFFLLLG